jgi:hydroxymethylpyrimidine/phosphomethylpyrimidine kinase
MSTSPEREPGCRSAMSVAGLDPCGGAGIIADSRTFEACGVYPMAVAATVTYQSTRGLEGRFDLPPLVVRRQLEAVIGDIVPDAVKTGALGGAGVVEEVAAVLENRKPGPLVVDPVLASGGGEPLLDPGGIEALKNSLIPLASIVTPNTSELSVLCGFEVFDLADTKAAALRLVEMGAQAVLITGVKTGEGADAEAADLLFDGMDFEVFTRRWVEGQDVHGTGCVMSAAIAAFLAKGKVLKDAVAGGRELVARAMGNPVRPGTGAACADPFALTREGE